MIRYIPIYPPSAQLGRRMIGPLSCGCVEVLLLVAGPLHWCMSDARPRAQS